MAQELLLHAMRFSHRKRTTRWDQAILPGIADILVISHRFL